MQELDISVKTPGRDVCIQLTIKGVWNKSHEEPLHYSNRTVTGCRIIDPSPETTHAINELLMALTSKDEE